MTKLVLFNIDGTLVDSLGIGRESVTKAFYDILAIGDTPLDVQCSKPYGACSIAVATGPFTYEKLRATPADDVLKDLSGACELEVFN